jgi:cysteine desulfurase
VYPGVDGNALLAALDARGFACSSGSACKSGTPEPSETLLALGLPRQLALGSLRVTVGKDTDPLDVERFLAVLPEVVAGLRRPAGPE